MKKYVKKMFIYEAGFLTRDQRCGLKSDLRQEFDSFRLHKI